MKYALVTVAAIICASPAAAALSGFHDSAEQISAIFNSTEVDMALRAAPVAAVENTGTRADGTREWQIKTQECSLTVHLRADRPDGGMVGKTTYEVISVGQCN